MNLCEKSGVLANVYGGFCAFKKGVDFRAGEKLFVLQEFSEVLCRIVAER